MAVNKFTLSRSIRSGRLTGIVTDDLIENALKIAEGSVIENILTGKQANGIQIKRNAPSTTRAKIERGNPSPRSLIDRYNRFIRERQGSWKHKIERKGDGKWSAFLLPATAELKDLNRSVQEKGYRGWFAPSKKALVFMCQYVRDEMHNRMLRIWGKVRR